MPGNQPYYEDVDMGDEIGPLHRAPTREQIRAYAGLGVNPRTSGRFFSDTGARDEGLQNVIAPGNLSLSFLAQLLTDWAGPQGKLKQLDLNFRRVVNPGDLLICTGLIIDKDEVDGECQVRVDVSMDNQRGEKPVVGTATVVLPRRAGG